MSNNPSYGRVVGPLQLVGAQAGSVSLQAQTVGTDYILFLPNHIPSAVGQLLLITNINGNILTADWTTADNFPVAPGQLTQDGATNGQVLEWNGTTWAPANPPAGGVSSFNSRTGAVSPQASDYAADYLALTGGTVTGVVNVTDQLVITSDASVLLPNVSAPFIVKNTAGTQTAEIVANSIFGAFIAFNGQGGPYTTSRSSEFGSQGWYTLGAAGISINGSQGNAGQVLSTLGRDADTGPAGMAWTNSFQIETLSNVTGRSIAINCTGSSSSINLNSDFGFINLSSAPGGPRYDLQAENAGMTIDASGNINIFTNDSNSTIELSPQSSVIVNGGASTQVSLHVTAGTGVGTNPFVIFTGHANVDRFNFLEASSAPVMQMIGAATIVGTGGITISGSGGGVSLVDTSSTGIAISETGSGGITITPGSGAQVNITNIRATGSFADSTDSTGSTGQVLTNNSGSAVWSSAPVAQVPLFATVTLTPSQIANLNTTPVQIVAAPGSGLYIVPVYATMNYHGGTGGFTVTPNDTTGFLFIGASGDANGNYSLDVFLGTSGTATGIDLTGTTNQIGLAGPSYEAQPATVLVNQALFVKVSGTTIGAGTGDGTLVVNLWYHVLPF